jgi:recombinational DNA repair protein RecT
LNPPKDPDEIARSPKLIWEYVKCAFSVATFPNGHQDFIVLPKFKLLKTWQQSEKSEISKMWPEEWMRKTAIRYHSKTLPHARKLLSAVAVMNQHEGVKKGKSESRLMRRIKK